MRMVKILFWNQYRKDLCELLCETVRASFADVVALIETKATVDRTLQALRSEISPDFHRPFGLSSRFHLFSRDPSLDLSEIYDGDRVSLRRLYHGNAELLLGLVHVLDRRNWGELAQFAQVELLVKEIQRREDGEGHRRTILIGDFNMNPFDRAMTLFSGMNAVMALQDAGRGKRVVQGLEYRYFYNPMWGLFGDRTPGPCGTYYHSNSSDGHYGWNMLDQVLVRPDAMRWFGEVEILRMAGERLLHTKAGRPCKRSASDHFPILLTLK
jgi:endonuclease/exonuclease/phosphatase (EEP) superfamily protein YafD